MTQAASGASGAIGSGKEQVQRTRRLIEEWMPIAALSEESIRERRSMTALPPTYYLHVWWARRPLVASRAAVLASLLPEEADQKKFMHMLGIHGHPVAARQVMDEAKRTGESYENPYGYERAFKYVPTAADHRWLRGELSDATPVVLDSTAGGGSIPFEALRLGCETIANDLNPVAWFVMKATVEFPALYGPELLKRYKSLASAWLERMNERVGPYFPQDPNPDRDDATFLWARTITCPYCAGKVPLSPNWRLKGADIGVRLITRTDDPNNRHCEFEIVESAREQSEGTVKAGSGLCPFPDCGRVFEAAEIQRQAQAGEMGDQLYAVVYTERRLAGHTKTGKPKYKKQRGFRAPRPEDDTSEQIQAALAEKLPEWDARDLIPTEPYPDNTNDNRPLRFGMPQWRNLFSPRQLLGHGTAVEVFRELLDECGGPNGVSELDRAALAYVAIAIDKMLDYNSRMSRFEVSKQRMANTFSRHDFAFSWSYAEMAPVVTGLGYDWVTTAVGKALRELCELSGHDTESAGTLHSDQGPDVPSISVIRGSGDNLQQVEDASVDAVVLDPPYYDNVMYAELADFFYVWLKRTAGELFPQEFADLLTDKDREAVANPAKFKSHSKVKGTGGAKKRANRDYQERMQAIFAECRRVLKPDGIMTLMFTHKATGAWDALAKGLVEAGFEITASWPIHTEAEGSLHIKEKNAAKSTILLACRPRAEQAADAEATYWEDVEGKVKGVVRERVVEFQEAGIGGVDLYLSCFGPALQVFSEHWPMTRGQPKQRPMKAKGAQFKLLEDEEFDPYEVRPEDALMAARAAVKEWRLEQIASLAKKRRAHIDPVTEWFVLAWDAFKSPQFPADEALKLARVVGLNFDEQLRGKILEVKSGNVILWDSTTRARKGATGSSRSACMLDPLHLAARAGRDQNTGVAKDIIERAVLVESSEFAIALQAVLEVLPTPRAVSGNAPAPLAGAAADAEALEKLRQLVFNKDVPQSEQ